VFVLREGGFTPVPGASRDSGAIAVSRDGRELFCEAGSFEAGWLDLASGAVRGAQEISSWLKTARLVRGDLVAATGAHGTALFDGRGREPRSLDPETGEGLAVSGDGAVICSGDRSGAVSCWSRGEVAPSAYVAAPAPRAAAGDAPEAEAPAALSVSGTIRSRKGRAVAVSLEGEAVPAAGDRGRLYKYFEKEIAGFRTSGWIDVATVEVESVGAGTAELRVVEEHSEIVVNGRRVDHFARGAKIRLDVE
jgi:hypothetical protein